MSVGVRRKIARCLRKWADLIDPRTKPSDPLTVTIECDASQLEETIERLTPRIKAFLGLAEKVNGIKDSGPDVTANRPIPRQEPDWNR